MTALPQSHEPYTDKYFLRSKEVLQKEGLNPWVRYQIFIRKGPGTVHGIQEAIDIVKTYSELEKHGGKIYALRDGSQYSQKETLMVLEGPVQDIIDLETMLLGVITAKTTAMNDGTGIDTRGIEHRMREVVKAADGRPVMYFGARHWHWSDDAAIAKACYDGGATSCSTGIGAGTVGQKAVGTIPHAIENVFAHKYGKDRAVVESTKAFNRAIDPSVPRIALIDYNNKELDDTIAVAKALGPSLYGIRVDTCGENRMQCVWKDFGPTDDRTWSQLSVDGDNLKYWLGHGVTITGVYELRKALNAAGRSDVKIILSSGFADPAKVREFVRAEGLFGVRLFDGLGVGGVYQCRMATMDIVGAGDSAATIMPLNKVGRTYSPNPRLELLLGGA